ncbi:hypothetical protein [Pseudomonas sp. Z3-8]|uniref:hypothetical protein n=1 Tax=unclassified Pseudomonas TaxID=196821 RepID=UPI003DA8E2CE
MLQAGWAGFFTEKCLTGGVVLRRFLRIQGSGNVFTSACFKKDLLSVISMAKSRTNEVFCTVSSAA